MKRIPKQFFVLLFFWVITFGFFIFTSPQELPIYVLVVPFLLLYISSYIGMRYFAGVVGLKQKQLIAHITATFVTVLLLLGSLHQLSFRDIAISLLIVTVLVWYMRRIQQ